MTNLVFKLRSSALAWFLLMVTSPAFAQDWKSSAAHWLTEPVVANTLIILGMAALVAAVVMVGTGLPETVAGVCFVLLFAGRFLAGTDPWVPLGLFLAGLLGIALEVFVIPGLGVFGIGGILALGASIVLLVGDLKTGVVVFLGSLVVATTCGFTLFKIFGNTKMFRKLIILEPPKPSDKPKVALALPGVEVGAVGVCASPLRPAGIVEIDGQRHDCVSEKGAFIQKDLYVEVVEVQGNKIVVRATPGQA